MKINKHNSPELYSFYQQQGGELSYKDFYDIIDEFNKSVVDEILLEGNPFPMGKYLSKIQVVRVERNYKGRNVNWAESYKLRDELLEEGKKLYDNETGEGHKWLVYYDDPWYCRYWWDKASCRVPDKGLYEFVPTYANKQKLSAQMDKGAVALTKYKKVKNVSKKS